MESAFEHVSTTSKQIGQDGHHIRAIVDRDSGTKKRVESGARSKIQTSECSYDGRDGELGIERHLMLRAHSGPAVAELTSSDR